MIEVKTEGTIAVIMTTTTPCFAFSLSLTRVFAIIFENAVEFGELLCLII